MVFLRILVYAQLAIAKWRVELKNKLKKQTDSLTPQGLTCGADAISACFEAFNTLVLEANETDETGAAPLAGCEIHNGGTESIVARRRGLFDMTKVANDERKFELHHEL
jgi:hypothetical protein